MRMYTRAFNMLREAEAFVNEKKIAKENIVNLTSCPDGTYILVYYAE